MYKPLSASKICYILNNKFNYSENYNNDKSFVICGSLNQFECIIKNFIKFKCKYLGCIINYNFHWSIIFIIKSKCQTFEKIPSEFKSKSNINYKIFYYNSYGQNINNDYYIIIKKYIKNYIYLYNNIIQQFDNYRCGIYVILVLVLLFYLVNKNVKSINKIKYIIESNNIKSMVYKFESDLINL